MHKQPIKILIACGSGIATSTVAQEKVKTILDRHNINYAIQKSSISQIPSLEKDVDLILVTSKYTSPISKPIIEVFGLLTGINTAAIENQIIQTITDINNNKEGK